jgi:YVTN family beta-propeller protein
MKRFGILVGAVFGLVFSACAEEYVSPCDLDWTANENMLYITGATGRKIMVLDIHSKKVRGKIEFPTTLNGTEVSHDGKTLYVTGDSYYGKLYYVDALKGKILKTFPVGHTPMSPVLSPDEKTLYVCNRLDSEVAFVDVATGKVTDRVPVVREPVSVAVTQDGKTLFVANHNPDGRADVDYMASKISVIDTATKAVADIKLVNGSEGVREVKISPDGKYAYVTHLMARFLVPTTQLERGWISTDALSVISVADKKLIYTILLDDVDMGFPNPWAIQFSDDGKQLMVSSAGNHEVSLIDLPGVIAKIEEEAKKSDTAAHLNAHNNLSFLSGLRTRIKLNGNGPRSIAVKDGIAYVANYFSDSIDLLNLDNHRIESVELNPDMKMTLERQGEIFFNDADLCFQNWLSCVTCHPDARTDALNWDLLNDGMGNPKNVRTMLMSHVTPPVMTLAVRKDAETAVRAGIKYIQFAVRPDEDAVAIDAYLKSLRPEMSPFLVDGKLSESAVRGKKLFEDSGCIRCHPAPLFTNLQQYDVGTTTGQDIGRPVDVPTLVEVWRTAPYLHDGRAATMREVITTFNHADTRGRTSKLTEDQIDDLVEYILSL